MMRKPNHQAKVIDLALVCLLLMSASFGCTMKKPWRNYEQQPFDSQKWRDGDALTRGTMVIDLHTKRTINGRSKEGVVQLLGEPERKRSNDGSEVWLYQVEMAGEKPRQFLPVSFDKNGRASAGIVRGGTFSILADE